MLICPPTNFVSSYSRSLTNDHTYNKQQTIELDKGTNFVQNQFRDK